MAKLVLFVLPLGLDTFAVSAALGLAGLPKQQRLKISLLLSGFEMAMPVIGLLIGHALGHAIGTAADYLAAAALLALGIWMLDGEEPVDELAMGLTIGLLHLSIVWAVILIGAQAFLFAQLGLRLGSRLNQAARGSAEKIAAVALLGLGVLVLVDTVA